MATIAFLDTFAILAILDGAPGYRKFLGSDVVAHEMNFLEAAVKLHQRRHPDPWMALDSLGVGLVPAERDDLRVAALLKAAPALRKRNLSYVEVLGYAMARRLEYVFVTGDRGLRGLPNVEFVAA